MEGKMISLVIIEMIDWLIDWLKSYLRKLPSFCARKSGQFHVPASLKTCPFDLSSSEIANKTVLKRVVLSDATILVYFAVAGNFRIAVWRKSNDTTRNWS